MPTISSSAQVLENNKTLEVAHKDLTLQEMQNQVGRVFSLDKPNLEELLANMEKHIKNNMNNPNQHTALMTFVDQAQSKLSEEEGVIGTIQMIEDKKFDLIASLSPLEPIRN